ncbi:MAG: phosphoenolpyruvate--protein phosphotransferase [Spirochaetes bacterium]|jgi:phosphotransferase system enzyme I (PtsP)|nr:phosphoenolpyruvate--protein phosphotransferase [Spirochaetota bacterium]
MAIIMDEERLRALLTDLWNLFERVYNLDESLQGLVDLLGERVGADLVAAYLFHERGRELRVHAASGSVPDHPIPARLPPTEGAVAEAFSRHSTVSDTDDVPGGPLPREDLPGFLVVPLQRGRVKLGVLIMQRSTRGGFTAELARGLRSLGSHLASTVDSVTAFTDLPEERQPAQAAEQEEPEAALVYGRIAAPGTAVGRAVLLDQAWSPDGNETADTEPPSEESSEEAGSRLDVALAASEKQLEQLKQDAEARLSELASVIFTSHILMLHDEHFSGRMRTRVAEGHSPRRAVIDTVNHYVEVFSSMQEARFGEKVQDVQDLGHRILANLDQREGEPTDYNDQIVIARNIFPSELMMLAAQSVEGVVFLGTGVTAHIAILAQSLGLPVLITGDPSILSVRAGTLLYLDADHGVLHIAPSDAVLTEAHGQVAAEQVSSPLTTQCGTRVYVMANVNIMRDAATARDHAADGIGLYRSEFPFIIRNDFPSEDEQYQIYRTIVQQMPQHEVVLRTADIGGDKLVDGSSPEEQNPFLGVRGIRFSLANRDLFRDQIRAMLRAGYDSDLHIMFPMVSSVDEVEAGREEVDHCIADLSREGIRHNATPKIGAMIELPSAVEAIEDLAAMSDFLSIGSNDLVMYLLAVDRTNERLSDLYRDYHPAVLKVHKRIVDGVGERLDHLSVCGDSAASPVMLPFYLGIGIRRFSVAPSRIPELRHRVGNLTIAEAQRISEEMLAIRSIRDMEQYFEEAVAPAG